MTYTPLVASAAVLACIAFGSAAANAQGLITTQKLSATLANQLVGESVAECTKKNYAVTAVVVDLDGVRQAVLRGDGERMAKNPPSTVPQTPLPNVTYAVGGVAIMAGGNIIGGIGVSGAPGGQFDEECARAALAKIADRMK